MSQTPPPDRIPPRRQIAYWLLGIVLYAGLGFSLGWYYTFTYYGRTGIPIPHPESCAAILLYYFSVINVVTEIQAVHWLAVFPLAGLLWAIALTRTAKYFGAPPPNLARTYALLALAAVPLIAPGPAMALLAGWTDGAFSLAHMFAVALRKANRTPDPWLTPLYLAVGLASLVLQWRVVRAACPLPLGAGLRHYLAAGVVLVLASMIAGSLLFYPLHFALE